MDQDNADEECIILITEDIPKVCRACLKENGLINLFQTEYKGRLLCDLFTLFCKVDVEEFDGFPQNVCNNCADLIIQFYIFTEKVQRSHTTLEETLGKENSGLKRKTQIIPKKESDSIQLKNDCSDDVIETEEKDFLLNDDCCEDISESSVSEIPVKLETSQIETDFDPLIDNTLTCSFCGITFTSKSVYKMHMKKENEIRKEETCKVCDQLFFKPKLKEHMREHIKNNDIVCKICDRSFAHPWHLAKHFPSHFKKTKEQCHICGKTISKINIEDHIRNHFDEKTISCNICDEKFITTRGLMQHKYEHKLETGEKQRQICKVCGKEVKKGKLSTHMEKHRLKMLCNECGKEFSDRSNLKRHIENVHRKLKPFKCQICDSNFSQKTSLKDHMKVHTGEKPYLCNECGRAFKQKNYLKIHIRNTHTSDVDPDNLTCKYCGKKFFFAYRLKMHMQQHSDKRPYSCHVCYRTFKQDSSLQVHLQYHDNNELYTCDLCPKTYISLVSLKLHRAKMHTHRLKYNYVETKGDNDVEKPFACPGCTRTFSYIWNLKKHIKVHEKEDKFICDVCFKIFGDPEEAEEHKTVEHETVNEDISDDSNL